MHSALACADIYHDLKTIAFIIFHSTIWNNIYSCLQEYSHHNEYNRRVSDDDDDDESEQMNHRRRHSTFPTGDNLKEAYDKFLFKAANEYLKRKFIQQMQQKNRSQPLHNGAVNEIEFKPHKGSTDDKNSQYNSGLTKFYDSGFNKNFRDNQSNQLNEFPVKTQAAVNILLVKSLISWCE